MRPTLYNNNQGTTPQNVEISGVSKYASADYGASWATTAAITAALNVAYEFPVNGDMITLWNTNGGSGRLYVMANGAWKYTTLT